MAIESITLVATNPGVGSAGVITPGNSLTVRRGSGVRVVGGEQTRTVGGFSTLSSPLLHDAVRGVQVGGGVGQSFFKSLSLPLESQDTLSVSMSGSGAAIEHTTYDIYYNKLEGVQSREIGIAEYLRRAVTMVGIRVAVTPGTTAFGTEVSLVAIDNQLKAGTDYALVGIHNMTGVATVGTHGIKVSGIDFGNLGVVLPGSAIVDQSMAGMHFLSLSRENNLPLIPVINSDNRAQVMVSAIGAAATATTAVILLMQLKGGK